MNKNLSIKIGEMDGDKKYQVIVFTGEFDKAGQSEIKDDLDTLVKGFEGVSLVFDFDNLRFINSEGIGYLMEIHTHLMKKDKRLVLVGPHDHIKDVFETIGINEIIPIFEDVDSFLNK